MKTLFNFVLVIMGVLTTLVSCQKNDGFDDEPSAINLSNQEMKDIYESLPSVGFESKSYAIAPYNDRDQRQQLISLSGEKLGLWQYWNSDPTYSDHFKIECFVVNTSPKFGGTVFYFYYNGTPFTKENIPYNDGYPLIISTLDFGGNSFFFKEYPYDYLREESGFYMNGQLIIDYILVEKGLPLSVGEMRVWKEKLILRIAYYLGDELLVIFDPKEKKIIYPNDFEKVLINNF